MGQGIPTGWPYTVPESWKVREDVDKGIIRHKGIFSVSLCYNIYNDPIHPVRACVHWPGQQPTVKDFASAGKAIQWANTYFEEKDGET